MLFSDECSKLGQKIYYLLSERFFEMQATYLPRPESIHAGSLKYPLISQFLYKIF
jgi:hypothetical protein